MAADSHFVKTNPRSEMARNAIKSDFQTSKMADGSHFVKNFQKKIKLCIDLKWPEIQSKVNFGHPKHFAKKIQKKIKFRIDQKWPEIRSKVNFGHPKVELQSEIRVPTGNPE